MIYQILLLIAWLLLVWLLVRHYHYGVVMVAALLPTYLIRLRPGVFPTTFFEIATVTLSAITLLTPQRRQAVRAMLLGGRSKSFILGASLFLMACVLSAAVAGSASLGILKGWVITPLLFAVSVAAAIKRYPPLGSSVASALSYSGAAVAVVAISQLGRMPRVIGIYDVPNSLALFLVPIIVLTLWPLTSLNAASGARAALMLIALAGTQSITGSGALLATWLLGTLWWQRGRRRRWSLAAAMVVTSLLASYVVSTGRVSYFARSWHVPQRATSVNVRQQLWSVAVELIREHPLRGIGLGQFEPQYQRILHKRINDRHGKNEPIREFVFRDPHNWLLSFWLNTGLLGLVSFIALNFGAIGYALKRYAFFPPQNRQALVLAVISLLLFGMADTIYWKNDLAALHWLLLCLLVFA